MRANLWPTQRVEQLKSLWKQGLPAKLIAKEIGIGRNAVLGKANRLGLKRNRPRGQHDMATPKPKTQKRVGIRFGRGKAGKVAPQHLTSSHVPSNARRKPIVELTSFDCRYPYGHAGRPDFFFCAAPKEIGSPYCEYHSFLCLRPARS